MYGLLGYTFRDPAHIFDQPESKQQHNMYWPLWNPSVEIVDLTQRDLLDMTEESLSNNEAS